MNVMKLTERLSESTDDILTVLESIGYSDFKVNLQRHEIRFSRAEGRNPSSILFNTDNLRYICFSTGSKGNLYTLIMEHRDLSFPKALNYITELLHYERKDFEQKITYPFGGYYRKLQSQIEEIELHQETLDEDILNEYKNKYNTQFFKDGIDYKTQELFQLGYDIISNRIIIPEYDLLGRIIGLMGRANYDCDKSERYLPLISCKRSMTLYGYHINYPYIQNKRICIVGEAEKFVLQTRSFGCNTCLSSCGCHLSDVQVRYLRGLLVDKIILAYDESLEEEVIREEARKLILDNQIFKNKVGYIIDREHKVIPEGSKGSPSDFGKEGFSYLMKHCVEWL